MTAFVAKPCKLERENIQILMNYLIQEFPRREPSLILPGTLEQEDFLHHFYTSQNAQCVKRAVFTAFQLYYALYLSVNRYSLSISSLKAKKKKHIYVKKTDFNKV